MKDYKAMIKGYREFNNCGEFTITENETEYMVRFDSHNKTLETEYPDKEALRIWFFELEEEEAEESTAKAETAQEIKKAFEQMKKELKSETGISGGFTMNRKQIESRTATCCLCADWDYDSAIEYFKSKDAEVQGFKSWSEQAKEDSHSRILKDIERMETCKAKYGTCANEAKAIANAIISSKAFAKFQKAVGNITTGIELNKSYYLRINY